LFYLQFIRGCKCKLYFQVFSIHTQRCLRISKQTDELKNILQTPSKDIRQAVLSNKTSLFNLHHESLINYRLYSLHPKESERTGQ